MKILKIFVVAGLFLASAYPALAKETANKMDHSDHVGKMIHETSVEGYRLAYHLLELDKGVGHHLMVYVTGPEGKKIEGAKLGFLIKGPDGSKQKLMAEGMKGAFGANADFRVVGAYLIKMKAVIGEKKLLDAFT
ncbi:MAG: hypothetical protein JRK53_21065, partial [Deltaproteobacteria bacterium]|nr:hypothetical protein [Deltaproteobacteria bacterium]